MILLGIIIAISAWLFYRRYKHGVVLLDENNDTTTCIGKVNSFGIRIARPNRWKNRSNMDNSTVILNEDGTCNTKNTSSYMPKYIKWKSLYPKK